jgi:acyl-homoserine lactone acylase PvdQ
MKLLIIILLFPIPLLAQRITQNKIMAWEKQALAVNIIRDKWGVPHIYGKTDADAVFGLLYAQCEDDFKRVELNYIEKLGRLSEVKGEDEIYNDLLVRLLIDSTDAITDYNKAEPWLKKLLNAFADGINYYLHKNPSVKPALIHHFKPWYPLLWTDGSIGAINTADITAGELKNFYSGIDAPLSLVNTKQDEQTGSNGFAVAPGRTEAGNAILYINPHTTFYFRPEVQVASEEGLNVYGAVTWGQFFIYQGFNEYCGWMHTSSNVDVADMYEETIEQKNDRFFYKYDGRLRPVQQKKIIIKYVDLDKIKEKSINAFYTHHGPVMSKRNGKWISLKSNNRSMTSLVQSWQRTVSNSFDDFKQVMDYRGNTSNSTVYADRAGNIALWHGNFIPIRDKTLNWAKPVDGTTSKTEWKGLHPVNETVHLYNPLNGWIQNCNSTPFTAAGENSPERANYPAYMAPDGENFRGVNAIRVLGREDKFTLAKMIAAGYDRKLSAFEVLLPPLINAFEGSDKNTSLYKKLKEPIQLLKAWDYNTGASSIATTLVVEWAQRLAPSIQQVYINEGEADQVQKTKRFASTAPPDQLINALHLVIDDLQARFGKWQVSWGDLNRFQRPAGYPPAFDDNKESLPVPFASATWGMLPSFNSRYFPGTRKRYGVSGNSFVCAVEFGPRIKARSLLAGGVSGDPSSGYFNNQSEMYANGEFKDVLFYKEDVLKHAVRNYHPGN